MQYVDTRFDSRLRDKKRTMTYKSVFPHPQNFQTYYFASISALQSSSTSSTHTHTASLPHFIILLPLIHMWKVLLWCRWHTHISFWHPPRAPQPSEPRGRKTNPEPEFLDDSACLSLRPWSQSIDESYRTKYISWPTIQQPCEKAKPGQSTMWTG